MPCARIAGTSSSRWTRRFRGWADGQVTYRVELHVAALAEMKGLPTEALDALVSRTVELIEEPLGYVCAVRGGA